MTNNDSIFLPEKLMCDDLSRIATKISNTLSPIYSCWDWSPMSSDVAVPEVSKFVKSVAIAFDGLSRSRRQKFQKNSRFVRLYALLKVFPRECICDYS